MRYIVLLASCAFCGYASAGDLVYQPINPSFGGNPLNSSHLYQGADIQNQFLDDGSRFDDLFEEPSLAEEFAEAIRNGMVSIAAGELIDSIVLQENPTGTMELDGAMVTWVTQGDRVVITVNDGVTTQTLDIPVPVIN